MARAWLPTDATSATLVGWFDAQDASTLTVESGGGVSAWRSKVGGWGVTQATAANQPPYSTYNNLPAVFPTTDSQFLSGAAPAALPTGSDAGVMSGVGTVIAYRNTYSTMFYWGSANGNKARSIAATGNAVSSGYYGNDVQGNVTWPGYTRLFISAISTAGYAEQWVDGGTVQAAQKNVLSTPASSTFWLCRSINGDPWKNPVQEVCLWKGTLSVDDRAYLEGYFAWRWNFVSQLPDGHRWKSAQPTVSGGPSLSAAAGAIGLTGRAANLLFGHTLPAGAGAVAMTGQVVRPFAGRRLTADGAGFLAAGQPVDLRRVGRRTIPATTGQIVLLGQSAGMRAVRRLMAAPGSLLLTGGTASMIRAKSFPLGRGAFVVTGAAVMIGFARRISGEPLTLSLLGQSAGLWLSRRVSASPGTFTVDLVPAIIIIGKPSAPIVVPVARKVSLTSNGTRRLVLNSAGSRRLTI